ncbi:hypothetical protein SAMN06265222_111177 [Neorhodopirellula lusitana]|uniref:Uncharacterized protein n=1 Tax=Neorhodopirellula lusitana TaxID=445327 RepID=A0ABY1QEF1_9BACT|nr:hypothetical protein SAMN06265222_111177 [Neorhodopirellula lusitana]
MLYTDTKRVNTLASIVEWVARMAQSFDNPPLAARSQNHRHFGSGEEHSIARIFLHRSMCPQQGSMFPQQERDVAHFVSQLVQNLSGDEKIELQPLRNGKRILCSFQLLQVSLIGLA